MRQDVIESRKNETLVLIRSLREKKYRNLYRRFFTEGMTLFSEALEAGLVPETVVLASSAAPELRERCLRALTPLPTRLLLVSDALYESVSDESAPQGVLAVFPFLEDTKNSRNIHKSVTTSGERYIILEKIQDPGNVGAMLRSAAAFGYTGAFLCGCADMYNPKTLRAAMGALFRLELSVFSAFSEVLEPLAARSLRLLGTSPHALTSIDKVSFAPPFAVLFGNEGAGVTPEALSKCDTVFSIPMHGMESLNAAAAAAVVLYETVRKST